MQSFIRPLMAAAALALLASCASTGENTEQTELDTTATAQPGVTAQPGQEAYSYAYGQAPGNYDSYDTSGNNASGSYPGAGAAGQPGQASAGGSVVSADRIVYFDFDRADIRPESQTVIESNARYLAKNPRIITQLEGHTDNRGSREYNIALGERRANAVRQVMGAMGIPPQQIRVVSYGQERPAASGYDEQSHALNRRVEIVY